MTTDVFYVTYAGDLQWFRWSLNVLQRNLSGYRNIVVVCPTHDEDAFRHLIEENPEVDRFRLHPVADWPSAGYYWQQWIKLNADTFTDADLIFHLDSDAFLKGPVQVSDFFTGTKPSWLWSYYSDFKEAVPWQQPTQRATGMTCPQEFMQGFPFILHRSTYARTREQLDRLHGDHRLYINTCAGAHPGFSEFNAMGRVAWEFEREKYAWVDRNRDAWPAGFHASRQFWSKAPLKSHLPEIQNMMEGTAHPAIRTTDRGIWIMANDTHISRWVEQHHRLDHDGHLLPKILALIKPGDVVVDVGAFIGDHTEGYAKAVIGDGEGSVLAFEPNPLPFECLRRNMAGHGHVQCINRGLSSMPGKMSIEQSPNTGASHMVAGDQVEVATLDSYGLTRCDLIKIDAEGFEFAILQGAWQTITRLRPILVLEINVGALERVGVLPEDIYHWLKLRGYRIEGHRNDALQWDVFCHPQ